MYFYLLSKNTKFFVKKERELNEKGIKITSNP